MILTLVAVFADISGFTKWSASRDPVQVFSLLESIYGAFDEVAKARGIFKIETIGDCYVAVAGLPRANPKHAVAMIRFAHDCRERFRAVVHDLEHSLGEGTVHLGLRVGIDSGPCTAGVLRGEEGRALGGRYQLDSSRRERAVDAHSQITASQNQGSGAGFTLGPSPLRPRDLTC